VPPGRPAAAQGYLWLTACQLFPLTKIKPEWIGSFCLCI
jgi:hypothetical protein